VRTLIVGIGSTIRGDDGVGVHVARELHHRPLSEGVDVIELGTAGLGLLDVVAGYDRLIVLDAIVSGERPGTVRVLAGDDVASAAHLGPGHEADLPTTLALGRKLAGEHMPQEVTVVAIEVRSLTSFSERLTDEAEAAIPAAVATVEDLLGQKRGRRS
jgi:hydrogenase maturation protease